MTGDVQPTHWDAALAQRWRAAGAWKDEPLGATFAAAADRRADAVAIVDGDRRITFTELDELTRRLATVLRQHDVTPGSTVTVQLPSWWETIALVIAAWRIGAVANPVLPNLRHHEVSLITAEVDSRVLVVPGEFRGFDYVAMARDLACAPTVLVARTTAAAPFARPEAARGEYTLDDLVRDAEPASDAVLDRAPTPIRTPPRWCSTRRAPPPDPRVPSTPTTRCGPRSTASKSCTSAPNAT